MVVEEKNEIINTKVFPEPSPDGRPSFDPRRRAAPEPEPVYEEHNVVAFPARFGGRQ